MKLTFINLFTEETGQGIVEYAFILMLVALICIIALTTIGKGAGNRINAVANEL